jgi:hypothetical protein
MIETFMWGYWGWGGSTRDLVKTFDAAEALRGYEPPIFVDVRVRREARAVGFRGDAFERMMGGERYRWIRGLGNEGILDRGAMRILDPSAAGELLDVIVAAGRSHRRVLFFCSCNRPPGRVGERCHRYLVGDLLVKEARRLRVALSVVEWPGGAPRRLIVRFPAAAARASLGTALSVPMPTKMSPAVGVSLPWGSYSMVEGPEGGVPVVVGPALHRQGQWSLQLPWWNLQGASTETQVQRVILAERKAWGCEARFSPSSTRSAVPQWEELAVEGAKRVRRGPRQTKVLATWLRPGI